MSCRAPSPAPYGGGYSQRKKERSRYRRRDPTQHHGRAELGSQFDRHGLGSVRRALEHEVAFFGFPLVSFDTKRDTPAALAAYRLT